MLGSFLECSIAVEEIGRAMQFYRSVGFQELPTGDFMPMPYVAMWDGNIVVGLTEGEDEPTLKFVRPDLRDYVPVLRRKRIELESAELGDEAFNSLVFRDPDGHRIELVEARTYSMAAREPSAVSACGRFLEVSLHTASLAESTAFWTGLGLATELDAGEPYPRTRLCGAGCALGLHQTRLAPGLSFDATQLAARTAFLRAHGITVTARGVPDCGGQEAVRLQPSHGIEIYMHELAGPA